MPDMRVLALHGDIDFSLGWRLGELFDPMFRVVFDGGTILDLTDVQFADAAFLGSLIRSSRALGTNRREGRTCIVAPRGTLVATLLEITRLDDVFPTFENVVSALGYLSSPEQPART